MLHQRSPEEEAAALPPPSTWKVRHYHRRFSPTTHEKWEVDQITSKNWHPRQNLWNLWSSLEAICRRFSGGLPARNPQLWPTQDNWKGDSLVVRWGLDWVEWQHRKRGWKSSEMREREGGCLHVESTITARLGGDTTWKQLSPTLPFSAPHFKNSVSIWSNPIFTFGMFLLVQYSTNLTEL